MISAKVEEEAGESANEFINPFITMMMMARRYDVKIFSNFTFLQKFFKFLFSAEILRIPLSARRRLVQSFNLIRRSMKLQSTGA